MNGSKGHIGRSGILAACVWCAMTATAWGALWTPSQLSSAKAWYDAADAGTLYQDVAGTLPVTANGQAVLRWNDKSGLGNYITSSSGPVYTTIAMNGNPVLRFADQGMARTAGVSMGNITDNFTVVGVFKVTGNNNWDNWVRWGNGGDGDPAAFVVSGSRAGGPAQAMEFAYDAGEGEATDSVVTGQPAFMFIGSLNQVVNPDLFSVWKDGTSQGSRNPTAAYRTTPSASLTQFRIGHYATATRNPNGDIAELLLLNTGTGTLSKTDRLMVEGYLANKWWGAGSANPLPSDHPYKLSGPVAPLVAHWRMDDNAANTAILAAVGSNATLEVNTNTPGVSVAGKLGGALNFANQYYSTVNSPSVLTGVDGFTASAWVKGYSNNDSEMVLVWSGSGKTIQLELHQNAMSTYSTDGGGRVGSALTWDPAVWYNVVWAQSDDGTMTMYRNGVLVGGPFTGRPAPTDSNFTAFQIGSQIGDAFQFMGSIDDVALWNQNLDLAHIKAVFGLADSSLSYDAGQAQQLFDLYAAGSGSASIGGRNWAYATGLYGYTDGQLVIGGGSEYMLVLNAANGLGVQSVPEPATMTMLVLSSMGLLAYRKRRGI